MEHTTPDIICAHNAGFFSCCTVRLNYICSFIEKNKRLPISIDAKNQFKIYKKKLEEDLNPLFFNNPIVSSTAISFKPIKFPNYLWRMNYTLPNLFDFNILNFLIKTYFNPSETVIQYHKEFENKNKLNYSNLAAIYFRGNDKRNEFQCPEYQTVISKANLLLSQNPNIKFLVQTDEAEFKQAFCSKFPEKCVVNDELPCLNKTLWKGVHNRNYEFEHLIEKSLLAVRFFSMVLALAKCRWVITTTTNVSLWMMLYRGNVANVYQWTEIKKDSEGKWIYGWNC